MYRHLLSALYCLIFLLPAAGQDNPLPRRDSTIVDTLAGEAATSVLGEYNEAYYQLDRLNVGLEERPAATNLRTPQAALEHFILNCRQSDFARAGYALNLNLLPERIQRDEAAVLAQKLHYVIRQRVPIDWNGLPDRADGQFSNAGGQSGSSTGPQRTIGFGTLTQPNGREVSLTLQRVRVKDRSPVWLISASTVENIEALYREYGPSWVDRAVPEWAEVRVLGIAVWKVIGVVLLAFISYLIARLLNSLIARLVRRVDTGWARDLSKLIATPLAVATGCLLFYLAMNNLLSIASGWAPYLYSFLLIVVIAAITWLVMRIIDYVIERISDTQIDDVSDEENLQSRRLLTYITVGRWVITFIVIAIGVGVVIAQFPQLRNLGFSLLASAGLATIILGVAAQSTLGNIIAGLQIAITKPARIGDSVITHTGEYGTVEDIRFTYLIVKTWDERRVVIPLKYFINHPFENWSLQNPHMLKPIILHADYHIDVDRLRKKFVELCKANENYDGESEPVVQVVDSNQKGIEVRCLCSAKDASTAWTLHVELREAMVRFLAELDGGNRLVREREEYMD